MTAMLINTMVIEEIHRRNRGKFDFFTILIPLFLSLSTIRDP